MLVITFTSCKKYPEDRGFQKKTAMKRIAKGWKVSQILIDNVDSTDRVYFSYFQSPAYEFKFSDLSVKFKKDKNPDGSSPDYRSITIGPASIISSGSARWKFINGKDNMVFWFNDKTCSFKFNNQNQSWDILSLTDSQLIIETTELKRKIKLTLN